MLTAIFLLRDFFYSPFFKIGVTRLELAASTSLK